ncbi:uncharacterized protein [Nothobranchius furzeri]|uniref:CBL-interacting protein kinase 24-like n=2 Tax=Nothobranchius TaxID=28779 RepID=A0A8C6M1E4_NOTFU|nr:transcript variant X1 [Nothobranchius furzeri]KAF7226761.1 transcript variant X2 [Nothobranchius furzeri]
MAYSTSTLAQGCFGKVYKEKYDDTWAAVKKVPQHLIERRDLERECLVYNKVVHPNIVKLLGNISLKDGKWIIPLEFIFGEDLETTVFKTAKSKIQLTPANKATIISGMCEGLLHLHSKDVVHQDLKPENIMVEHNTNRAVIIDLGLAKFYRQGLNSAIDMGNEAYSAPEVLQRKSQRSQRSDVWAMGKIIAEVCARIRLYTPSVCPAKIVATLKDNPYCSVVCRMVEPDPTKRATMYGVMNDIHRAGTILNASSPKEPTKAPVNNITAKNPSPSPVHRDVTPFNRDILPVNNDPPRFTGRRSPSPSPVHRDVTPFNRNILPVNNDPPLFIGRRSPSPSPVHRDVTPFNRNILPVNNDPPRFTGRRSPSPSPVHRDVTPFNRNILPVNNDPPRFTGRRSPSPSRWEPAPKPEPKPEAKPYQFQTRLTNLPSSMLAENKNQALTPARKTNITQDVMKMKLYEEAAKDFPFGLPPTGKVVVQHFQEKDGEVDHWEQKTVVTRDGKIVTYDDITLHNK